MQLNEFITSKSLTQSAFGALLDPPVSQGLVSQWIRGETRITLDQALQIEKITDGEVSCRECSDLYKAKKQGEQIEAKVA